MGFFYECSRTTQVALRGRFIQTLTEKSIDQNMRGQGYDSSAKGDNGSNETRGMGTRGRGT